MKSLLKMTLIGGAIALALVGCDDKNENTAQTTANANSANQEMNIEVNDKVEAYAVGSSFGSYLKGNLEQGKVTLNTDEVIKGFSDGFKGKSKYNPQEIQTILNALDTRIEKENETRLAAATKESTEAGDKYRQEFASQPDVKQTDSGLLYEVIAEGSAQHPTGEDVVIVHYTGTLVNGEKFDSSYDRGEPTNFPLNRVIPGWQEGIELIGVGGKIKLVVPPELAYGNEEKPAFGNNAGIPPASTLVFEVELLGIDDSNQ